MPWSLSPPWIPDTCTFQVHEVQMRMLSSSSSSNAWNHGTHPAMDPARNHVPRTSTPRAASPITANKEALAPCNAPAHGPREVHGEQPFTRQARVGSPEQSPLCAAIPWIPCSGFSRLASWAGCLLRWPAAAFPLEGPSSRISSLGPRDHMFFSPQRTSAAGPVTALPGGKLK